MIQFPNKVMTPPNPPTTPPTPPPTPMPPSPNNNSSQEEEEEEEEVDEDQQQLRTPYYKKEKTKKKENNEFLIDDKYAEEKYRYKAVSNFINKIPSVSDDEEENDVINDNASFGDDDASWMSGMSQRTTSTYGGGGMTSTMAKTTRENMKLRAQLWDAYRLARIILGKSIGTSFRLESGTILNAIRHVAEMKLELLSLRKEVDFLERLEQQTNNSIGSGGSSTSSSRSNSPTKKQTQQQQQQQQQQEITLLESSSFSSSSNNSIAKQSQLAIQVTNLKRQLYDSQSKYTELSTRHSTYVNETKTKLDSIFHRLMDLPKPKHHDSQAREVLFSLQQLMEQVAEASLKTKIDELQAQHDVAKSTAQEAQLELQKLSKLKQNSSSDKQMQQQLQIVEHQHEKELEMVHAKYQLQLEDNLGHLDTYKEQVKRQQQELYYYRKKCERLESQKQVGSKLFSTQGSVVSTSSKDSTDGDKNKQRTQKQQQETIGNQAMVVAAYSTTPAALQEIIYRLQKQQQQVQHQQLQQKSSPYNAETPTASNTTSSKNDNSASTNPSTTTTTIPEEEIPDPNSTTTITATTMNNDATTTNAVRMTVNSESEEQQQEEEYLLRQHIIKLLSKMMTAHKRHEQVKELKLQYATIKSKEKESEEEVIHLKNQLEILQRETQISPQEWERQIKADRTIYKQRLKACIAQEEQRITQMEAIEEQCQLLTMTAIEIEDLSKDLFTNRQVYEEQLSKIKNIPSEEISLSPTATQQQQNQSVQLQTIQDQLKSIQVEQQQSLDNVVSALEQIAVMSTIIPNREFKEALKELQQFATAGKTTTTKHKKKNKKDSSSNKKDDNDTDETTDNNDTNVLSLAKELQQKVKRLTTIRDEFMKNLNTNKKAANRPDEEKEQQETDNNNNDDDTTSNHEEDDSENNGVFC